MQLSSGQAFRVLTRIFIPRGDRHDHRRSVEIAAALPREDRQLCPQIVPLAARNRAQLPITQGAEDHHGQEPEAEPPSLISALAVIGTIISGSSAKWHFSAGAAGRRRSGSGSAGRVLASS